MRRSYSVFRLRSASGFQNFAAQENSDCFSGKYIYIASEQEEPDPARIRRMLSGVSGSPDLILPVSHTWFPEDEIWEEPVKDSVRLILERFRCPPILAGALIRKKFLLECLRENRHDLIHSPCPDLFFLLFCSPVTAVIRTDYCCGKEFFLQYAKNFGEAAKLLDHEDFSVRVQLLQYKDLLMDLAVRLKLSSEEILELFDPSTVVYNYYTRHPGLLNELRLNHPPAKTGPIRNLAVFCWGLRSGGIERVASLLLTHWASKGNFKLYFLSNTASQPGDYVCPENVEITVLPKRPFDRRIKTADFLRENKIDVCIFLDYYKPCSFWDILTASEAGVRTIAMIHNVFFSILISDYPQPELLALRKTVYPVTDIVTCLSRSDELLWNQLGIKARYMPNPVTFDTSARPAFAERKNKNLILIARMTPVKGVLDALKTVEIVREKHPEVKLFLLGNFSEPAYEQECHDFVKSHALNDNIVFTGFTDKVGEYLAGASIHMMPSSVEGWNLTLLEAKFYGLPTVAYEMPYLETLKDEFGSFMVPQRDFRAMAAKISELLDDFGKLNEIARKAYDSLKWFDNSMVFSRWDAVFQWLETGAEPAELGIPEISDKRKLELLKFQTAGIISGISKINVSPVYRKSLMNESHMEQRHNNLLYDLVIRIYFALREKAGNRFVSSGMKFFLSCIWNMKRIYRKLKPWDDKEQIL